MNIFEIKRRLSELKLNSDEVAVVGSGILEILEIRPSGDLDLLVDPQKKAELSRRDHQVVQYPNGESGLMIGDIEIVDNWFGESLENIKAKGVVIDGLTFLPLHEVRNYKIRLNRPKDQRDVVLIDDYLRANSDTI